MSLKLTTEEVRFSFPHVFEAFAFEDEKPKYSVMILIPKTDKKTLRKIKAAEKAAIDKGIGSTWGGKRPKQIASILKDGDDDADDYPERSGCYYMTVRSNTRPQVVDAAVQPILDASEIYSGVYGRVSLNAFPYEYAKKAGVSFGLNNVQKTNDGESLAGGTTADEDFDEFDVDEFDFDEIGEDEDDLI